MGKSLHLCLQGHSIVSKRRRSWKQELLARTHSQSNALRLFGLQKGPSAKEAEEPGKRVSPFPLVQPGKINSWPRELTAFFFPDMVWPWRSPASLRVNICCHLCFYLLLLRFLPFCKTGSSQVETRRLGAEKPGVCLVCLLRPVVARPLASPGVSS